VSRFITELRWALGERVRAMGPAGLVWGALGLSVAIALASVLDARGLRRLQMLQRDSARQEAANVELRAQDAELARTIKGLGEPVDKAALERAAREQLGFVKPDEIVFKFE
jgi:cell division protein FtsB